MIDEAMTIRKSTERDLPEIFRIYEDARRFMRESGNPNQWKNTNPTIEMIEGDIKTGTGYVCEKDGEIAAVFYFNIEIDPTYGKINGKWSNDEPYGVIHRIARDRNAKGAGEFCINWCFEQCGNLRIDTHEDNAPMRRLLGRIGFEYCGIIWLENGEERLAFQKTQP